MNLPDGQFFPPDYKTFPFSAGDVLVSQPQDGLYSLTKVLRVDHIIVRKGDSISIQGQRFAAPEDDYLLIISSAYGEAEFTTLEEARAAAESDLWTRRYIHIPNRAPGAAIGQSLIGHAPVRPEEMEGYYLWRQAFDRKEAGVF